MLARLFGTAPKCTTSDELISLIKSAGSEDEIRHILNHIDDYRLLNTTHFPVENYDAAIALDDAEDLEEKLKDHITLDRFFLRGLLEQGRKLKTKSPEIDLNPEDFSITESKSEPRSFASCPEGWKIFLEALDQFVKECKESKERIERNRRFQALVFERADQVSLEMRKKYHHNF